MHACCCRCCWRWRWRRQYNYDMAGLAALRRRLTAAVHDFKGATAQYEEVIRQVGGGSKDCAPGCVVLRPYLRLVPAHAARPAAGPLARPARTAQPLAPRDVSAAAAAARQALDLEAVIKCRQLGVYEPPGLPANAAGAAASATRLAWRWRCVAQVRCGSAERTLPCGCVSAHAQPAADWRRPCCGHVRAPAQPSVRKVAAAALGAMSACVVWSEATIFTGGHPDLSPFSRMIRRARAWPVCMAHHGACHGAWRRQLLHLQHAR